MSDKDAESLIGASRVIGTPMSRVGSAVKVTGEANFTAEVPLAGLAHVSLICSTRSAGAPSTSTLTRPSMRRRGIHHEASRCAEAERRATAPINSCGAHFCQVRVSDVTGEVCASRGVAVFDTGRVINPETGTSSSAAASST